MDGNGERDAKKIGAGEATRGGIDKTKRAGRTAQTESRIERPDQTALKKQEDLVIVAKQRHRLRSDVAVMSYIPLDNMTRRDNTGHPGEKEVGCCVGHDEHDHETTERQA